MNEHEWVIEGNRVCVYRRDTSSLVCPPAGEIYSLVFEGKREVDGIGPVLKSPAEALPELRFSRFPFDVSILVTGQTVGNIVVSISGQANEQNLALISSSDQVVLNGTWWPVETDEVNEARKWLKSVRIEEDIPITLGDLFRLRLRTDAPIAILDKTDLSAPLLAAAAIPKASDLRGLDADLYPYQLIGIGFLCLVADQGIGCILADEMGLGKTLQAIGLMTAEFNNSKGQTLVVVPATLVTNWRRELAIFNPSLRVTSHTGGSRAGVPERLQGYDVVITTYETAVRDELLLADIDWNLLVVDEAQAMKNPAAQRTLALKRLPRRISVALTGTPVENSLEDLWSLTDFAMPGLLGDISDFRPRFFNDFESASHLASIVEPIILRRRVKDVAKDLPALIEIPQAIDMEAILAQTYEKLRLDAIAENGGLASLVRLRMFCTHPSLVIDWSTDPSVAMPKFQRLIEILDEIFQGNEKALVFTSFQGMVDLLLAALSRLWPAGYFESIDGRVPVDRRQPIVDSFSDQVGIGALVLNPQAAGVGLNITAANHVIHYNPEWNPARTDQASRRAYRRKQQLPVTVHHLYFAGTLEELIVSNSVFKRELASQAARGHEGQWMPIDILDALRLSPVIGRE